MGWRRVFVGAAPPFHFCFEGWGAGSAVSLWVGTPFVVEGGWGLAVMGRGPGGDARFCFVLHCRCLCV